MIFKKLRIIEAGPTANSWGEEVNGEWKEALIVIKPESIASLVALGNERPIHARRSHNGADMLDRYIGSFSNFIEEDGVAYADLTISEAADFLQVYSPNLLRKRQVKRRKMKKPSWLTK